MNFTSRIRLTIKEHGIFQPEDLILVALSGGADSVALLRVLQQLGYHIEALHCNFHLRGEESNRDESFVNQLCDKLSIPLHIKHFDTQVYACEKKVSVEMAARDLRYEWFNQMLQELNAQCIAVAHHQNDQAETLLLNILRGTGLRGLAGMRHINDCIRRPMLDVTRKDIQAYLSDIHQDYVTDSTNLERDALRNRVRLDILPAMAELNPNISEALSTLASNVQDALPIYERGLTLFNSGQASMKEEELTLNSPSCPSNAAPSTSSPLCYSPFSIEEATLTLLHEWASGYGFNRTQLQNILHAETGRIIETGTHRLLRDRKQFVLHDKTVTPQPTCIRTEVRPVEEVGKMVAGRAYLDQALVQMPLQVRRVQPSDRFTPLGMNGSKLVSDYLTDLKMNRFEKEFQEVVTDATGKILWVIGHAQDHHYRITPTTQHVIIITNK